MAWTAPDVGEIELLKRILYEDASAENWTLKLFASNITPAESDTEAAYNAAEATFTGYSTATLLSTNTAPTWSAPTTSVGTTSSTYGTPKVYNVASSQTVYGYYVVGATSGKLLFAEDFGARSLVSGDTLTLTPRVTLG